MLQKVKRAERRAVNVTLDAALIREAKELGINMSRAGEAGILAAVNAEQDRRWKEENREAIQNLNDYVKENGIPFAEFQQF